MGKLTVNWLFAFMAALLASSPTPLRAGESTTDEMTPDNRMVEDYLKTETVKISAAGLSNVSSLADWQARRPELRRQAAEMLGLDPTPQRTALNPVITGKLEQNDFTVD